MSLALDQTLSDYCEQLARDAQQAARQLLAQPVQHRQLALQRLAQLIEGHAETLMSANQKDLDHAQNHGLSSAMIDRLRLTPDRIAGLAQSVREIEQLPNPLGKVLASEVRPNGLQIRKVSVPLGVVLFIYESRPNVTIDAAALCLKSGNAVILRGGKEARHSNQALANLVQTALRETNLPPAAASLVNTVDRQAVSELLQLHQFIDVTIPRGGEGLITRVADEATMPVIKHYKGVCHVYVDESADLNMAEDIIINAKTQRPGVCNAAEGLLIHKKIAPDFLPRVAKRLQDHRVEIRGCAGTCQLVPSAKPAAPADFGHEHLDLILTVCLVNDLNHAIDYIARNGSGHTETIITNNLTSAETFLNQVDASAVMVNASTRFNDGGQLGLGAEIGISTDKFHARGPCGLEALTSYKYQIMGTGQIRM